MKKANLIVAALCAILGITIIAIASGYPTAEAYGTGAPGPGLWPICISIVLLVCTLILTVRTLKMKPEQDEAIHIWGEGPRRTYISMAVLLVYVMILPILGFLPTTLAMLIFFIKWFSDYSIKKTAIISLAVTLIIYFVFKSFLNVPIDFGLIAI